MLKAVQNMVNLADDWNSLTYSNFEKEYYLLEHN